MRFFLISILLMLLVAIAGCGREGVSAQKTEAGGAALGEKLAKRAGPPDVEPVIISGVKFAVIHWGKSRGFGQNGGYIGAFDADTGTELWTLKVYDVSYDPQKEQDVQDIFIESMTKTESGDRLLITDEAGRAYSVDPETRTVQPR